MDKAKGLLSNVTIIVIKGSKKREPPNIPHKPPKNFDAGSSEGPSNIDENENILNNNDAVPSVEECLSFYLNGNADQNPENEVESEQSEDEAPLYVNGKSVIRGSNKRRRFICSLCDRAFTEKQNLEYHMVIHTGERNFICGICKSSFSHRHHLTQHIATHDDSTARKHTCNTCGRSFRQGFNLTRHLVTHTRERRFFCQLCNASFTTAVSLRDHLYIHSDHKPFDCEFCDKSFRKKHHLKRHLETHSSEESPRRRRKRKSSAAKRPTTKDKLVCDECQERFPSRAKLRNHDCMYVAPGYVERKLRKRKETVTVSDDEENEQEVTGDEFVEIKVEQESD